MRTKAISFLAVLLLFMSVFALPLTVYAAGGNDTTPLKLTATLTDGKLSVSATDDMSGVEGIYVDGNRINSLADGAATVILKDYAGTGKQINVYAEDYAGNRSDTVKFDNPYYEAPKATETPAATTKPSTSDSGSSQNTSTGNTGSTSQNGNSGSNQNTTTRQDTSTEENESSETTSSIPEGAFTPEGTGSVLDSATSTEDDKQFYTITTEAGNVFYLIIDGKRDSNNVYFLNGVTESDLLALAEKDGNSVSSIPAAETCTCTDKCEAGQVNTNCLVCKNDLTSCKGTAKIVEADDPVAEEPAKNDSSTGTVIFLLIAFAAVAGVGYYVKIVRPKQQAEDEDDFDDDGYGEGFDPDAAYGEPEYLSEDDFDDRDSN